jgi:hypothetical protein
MGNNPNSELARIGFDRKNNSNLLSVLRSYNPDNGRGTAVRNAIISGLIKINDAIKILQDASIT